MNTGSLIFLRKAKKILQLQGFLLTNDHSSYAVNSLQVSFFNKELNSMSNSYPTYAKEGLQLWFCWKQSTDRICTIYDFFFQIFINWKIFYTICSYFSSPHIAVTYFLLNFIINECLFNVNTFQGIHWNPTDIILNRKRKRNGYIPFLRIINIILLLQL